MNPLSVFLAVALVLPAAAEEISEGAFRSDVFAVEMDAAQAAAEAKRAVEAAKLALSPNRIAGDGLRCLTVGTHTDQLPHFGPGTGPLMTDRACLVDPYPTDEAFQEAWGRFTVLVRSTGKGPIETKFQMYQYGLGRGWAKEDVFDPNLHWRDEAIVEYPEAAGQGKAYRTFGKHLRGYRFTETNGRSHLNVAFIEFTASHSGKLDQVKYFDLDVGPDGKIMWVQAGPGPQPRSSEVGSQITEISQIRWKQFIFSWLSEADLTDK